MHVYKGFVVHDCVWRIHLFLFLLHSDKSTNKLVAEICSFRALHLVIFSIHIWLMLEVLQPLLFLLGMVVSVAEEKRAFLSFVKMPNCFVYTFQVSVTWNTFFFLIFSTVISEQFSKKTYSLGLGVANCLDLGMTIKRLVSVLPTNYLIYICRGLLMEIGGISWSWVFVCCFFEIESHSIAQVSLKLTL